MDAAKAEALAQYRQTLMEARLVEAKLTASTSTRDLDCSRV